MGSSKNREKRHSRKGVNTREVHLARITEMAAETRTLPQERENIDEHRQPQYKPRNTDENPQQNGDERRSERSEEIIVMEEVIEIEEMEFDTVDLSLDRVDQMEDESQALPEGENLNLDSGYYSISESPAPEKPSSRSVTSDDNKVDEHDQKNKAGDEESEISYRENPENCEPAWRSTTLESPQQLFNLDGENSDAHCRSLLQSMEDHHDTEGDPSDADPHPYLRDYGDSWSLPYIDGISKPYSAGGYFSDEEDILPNIRQCEQNSKIPDLSTDHPHVQEKTSELGSRSENILDDGGFWSDVTSDNDDGSVYTDFSSHDDEESSYADICSGDEEEDWSMEIPPALNKGMPHASAYKNNRKNSRNITRKLQQAKELYRKNIKKGKERYSRTLAKEIENTFTDDSIKGLNTGVRVICNTFELLKMFLGYLSFHSQFCASIKSLKLGNISRQGMRELYAWSCGTCAFSFKIWSDYAMNTTALHEALVLGTLTAGIGYNVTREVLSSLSVTCISDKLYRATRSNLSPLIKKVSTKSMKAAAARERQLALKAGNVIKGVPYITVIVDGAWSKRGYQGGQYNALSGVAVIVGYRTRKVIYCGTLNKYCKYCEVAESAKVLPGSHNCAKNYSRQAASGAMEPQILLEGFMRSVKDYGLIYKYMIGDGDSSVYSSITDHNPYDEYGVEVTKIECVNHLFRRFGNRLKEISKQSLKGVTLQRGKLGPLRRALHDGGRPLRKLITKMVDYWDAKDLTLDEKANHVRDDILKMIRHHFGNHSDCSECAEDCPAANSTVQESMWSKIIEVNWEKDIESAASRLQINAKNLLLRSTNNAAEGFHSIGNKSLGGRRVNHTATDDYVLRQNCTAIQYNSQHALSELHAEAGKIPTAVLKMEQQKINQSARTALSRVNNRRIRNKGGGGGRDSYGTHAGRHLSETEFNEGKARILRELQEKQKIRDEVQKRTILQRNSDEWKTLHRKILTASHFARICKLKDKTGCRNAVYDVLYRKISSEHVNYGVDNEARALQDLEKEIKMKIEPCGLFIDEQFEYLGASPDGLIGDDGIVEVKCLSTSRHLTPEQAVKETTLHRTIFTKDGKMNEKHNYFYQVQGQLHITQRLYCVFAVWTPLGIKYDRVGRDDQFWKTKMEMKLCRFYLQCVLRELVDKKIIDGRPIEEPEYIREAQRIDAEKRAKIPASKKRKLKNDEGIQPGISTSELPRKRRKKTKELCDDKVSQTDADVESNDDGLTREQVGKKNQNIDLMSKNFLNRYSQKPKKVKRQAPKKRKMEEDKEIPKKISTAELPRKRRKETGKLSDGETLQTDADDESNEDGGNEGSENLTREPVGNENQTMDLMSKNLLNRNLQYPKNFPNKEHQVFGIHINRDSWTKLNPRGTIDDAVVNAFLLNVQALAQADDFQFLVVETYFLAVYIEEEKVRQGFITWARKREAWRYDLWLVPVHLKKRHHWTLLMVNFKDHRIIYFDSCRIDNMDLATKAVNGIKKLIDTTCSLHRKIDWNEWEVYQPKDVPQQRGGTNNCGPHILSWAYIIGTGSYTTFIDQDMTYVRRGITQILWTSESNQPNNVNNADMLQCAIENTEIFQTEKTNLNVHFLEQPPYGYESTSRYCASLESLMKSDSP